MTPAARVQAAIDILDGIIAAARDNGPAADTLIADWFRTRRFAGSSDRRAVRELVYRALRRFGERPEGGRAAMVGLAREDGDLALLFDGSNYGPAGVGEGESGASGRSMPGWLGALLPSAEHEALLGRAPLDLRANALKTTREAMLGAFPGSQTIAGTAHGLRLREPRPIEQDEAWRAGLVEVQEAGSQMIVAACAARAGMTVVDLCAGGGGKTLALAADMRGEGRLIACDTDKRRLANLAPRAERAGAAVEVRLLDGGREGEMLSDLETAADIVLVDAPCSGTGTLRRNPEARWRLTPERLDRVIAIQRYVLDLAVPLIKPGGVLVYAVCSLIEAEGCKQVAAFVDRRPGWRIEMERKLTPSRDDTDGFFFARLRNAC